MNKTLPTMLALLILAGCVNTPADDLVADPPLTSVLDVVSYQACVEQDVAIPVPMDSFDGMLPEGFTPVTFAGDPSGQTAAVVIWTDACRTGTVGGAEQTAPGEMWGYLPVNVPQELQQDSLDGYLVVLGAFVQDPAAAAMYHSWGISELNLSVGSVSLASLGDASSPLRAATAEGRDANFTVSVSASAGGLTATLDGGTVRAFILGPGASIVGAFDNTWSPYAAMTHSGHATVQFQGAGETTMGLPTGTNGYPGIGNVLSGISYQNARVDLNLSANVTESPAPAGPYTLKALTF